MATVIRFARHGSKKKPYFRIVVQDSRQKRDGRFIEHIGAYNPIKGADSLVISKPRLDYWVSTGAQISDSVRNRLKGLATAVKSSTPAAPAAKTAPQDKP